MSDQYPDAAAAMAVDREAKKKLVHEHLAVECTEGSPHADLRTIATALGTGDQLVCDVIAGGLTNYSYKVSLEQSPDLKLFAKISFPYALWNPDRTIHYDIERTQNEFAAMSRYASSMGDTAPIARPYLCLDVEPNMKLLVTQWSPADEQWSNQFIDGEIDHRVIPIFARAFAHLNMMSVEDPMFNDFVRPCFRSLFALSKTLFARLIESDCQDKVAKLARELGQEAFDKLADGMDDSFMSREAMVHSDVHVFNLLVEPKTVDGFGLDAKAIICDWEMCMVGPLSIDMGKFWFFPLACALCHAAHGRREAAQDILLGMEQFWEAYAEELVNEGGRDESFLLRTYREAMGWASINVFTAIYQMGVFADSLPLDGLDNETKARALASIGYVGLEFQRFGFSDYESHLSLDELKARFRGLLESEFSDLLQLSAKPSPRRESMLRVSGRRVSDASLYDESVRRLTADPDDRRPSFLDVSSLRGA